MRRRRLRPAAAALAGAAIVAAPGCDLADELLDRDGPARALRAAAVEGLAGTDARLLDRIGDGPVLRTEAVSDTVTRVVVPDGGAPDGEAVWELALSRLEVYPVFAGRDFARYVHDRATARDRRRGLTQSGWSLVADGGVEAVGLVEGEARAVGGSGRVPVSRVAYLEPAPEREEGRWALQPDTRTVLRLRGALQATYEGLMYGDDRVLDCAGTAEPMSAPRPVLLECATEVLAAEFGGDESP